MPLVIRVREFHRGPLFDGRVRRAVDDFVDDWEEEAAEWALDHIKRTYHVSFKNPTGYYESHVRIRNGSGGPEVNDGGIIEYGPWLEGVGSRNNTTRFKGYHAFRKAATALERIAHRIGDRLWDNSYDRRVN